MKLGPIQVLVFLIASQVVVLACQLDQYLAQEIPTQDIPTLAPTDMPAVAVPRSNQSPTPAAGPKNTPIPVRIFAVATADQKVYSSPSTNSQVISTLAKGNTLQVVGRTEKNDWWYVVLPGSSSQQGWLAAKTNTLNGPIDSIPIVRFAAGTPQVITNTPPKPTATVPKPTVPAVPSSTRAPGQAQPTPTPSSKNPFEHHGL